MDTPPLHRKRTSLGLLLAGNIFVFALFFVIIEGLASYALVIRDLKTESLAERRYTKYDPLLGWVNEPNVYIRDMYGPGVYLRTNAQGFRNKRDINTAVPRGKTRVVCSGDSFTLGYGVDNDHTWCGLLSIRDPRLETVNMGQGGYGVDQAYLWYKRDAPKIAHQVQLFAFITDDFYRMLRNSFYGYGKPVLEVKNGTLVVQNVPVPRRAYYIPWITQNIDNLRQLRTVEFLNRAVEFLNRRSQKSSVPTVVSQQLAQSKMDDKARKLLGKIIEDLKRINDRESSKLVLVYLPTLYELEGKNAPHERTNPEEWTEFLEEESRSLEIPLVNLYSEFRSLPKEEMVRLFIPSSGATGHFNNAGNELVEKVIDENLSRILPGIT